MGGVGETERALEHELVSSGDQHRAGQLVSPDERFDVGGDPRGDQRRVGRRLDGCRESEKGKQGWHLASGAGLTRPYGFGMAGSSDIGYGAR